MKLIWTKPHKCGSRSLNYRNEEFESFYIGEALKGYLMYRNIFIGTERVDFKIEYNPLYHFYDISLFEHEGGPGRGDETYRRKHIDEAIKVLQDDGAIITNIGSTLRWKDEVKLTGKRFWIQSIEENNVELHPCC